MAKVIVYCVDGTWNGAGHNSILEKDKPELSNVYRLFCELRGTSITQVDGGVGLWAEEKEYIDSDDLAQVAMYAHGVGENAHNIEEHVIGGAFGGGLTTRIRLGYAFISRRFVPDDIIVIIGFSRGSYAARALADMIATQGLLNPELATEHHTLSWAAGAWLSYLEHKPDREVAAIVLESEALHRTALQAIGRILSVAQLRPAKVSCVGVFDTVGSMGFPDSRGGVRADDFGYVSETLLPGIERAYHAVSLDERRAEFIPTLWKPITAGTTGQALEQTLFPGAHSDVGGGYEDHTLSDVTFEWMFNNILSTVIFKGALPIADISPNPLGLAHCPWLGALSRFDSKARALPKATLERSSSLCDRMAAPLVPLEGFGLVKYDPTNLPDGIECMIGQPFGNGAMKMDNLTDSES